MCSFSIIFILEEVKTFLKSMSLRFLWNKSKMESKIENPTHSFRDEPRASARIRTVD